MRLNHIALNIHDEQELNSFYQNILGFYPEYKFNLSIELATTIFGIQNQPAGYLYKHDNLVLELFIYSESFTRQGFTHICLEVEQRENIIERSEKAGYQTTRIPRDNKPDILFIRDKTGNIFELKNTTDV